MKSWGEVAPTNRGALAAKPLLSTQRLRAVQKVRPASVDATLVSVGWTLARKGAAMNFRQLANLTRGYATADAPGPPRATTTSRSRAGLVRSKKFSVSRSPRRSPRVSAHVILRTGLFSVIATTSAGWPTPATCLAQPRLLARRRNRYGKSFFRRSLPAGGRELVARSRGGREAQGLFCAWQLRPRRQPDAPRPRCVWDEFLGQRAPARRRARGAGLSLRAKLRAKFSFAPAAVNC